ncbi:MAG: hypothetical protein LBQ01_07315 [Prevotellaceae bacterium]|jgi:hypothetical protein|nr:hypothetical protein [Prevotellaceae bacterium]
MNIEQPDASVFVYRITYFNAEFEIIAEKIIACYYLMIDDGIILPNDENKIRNELTNNYLNENNVRNKIGLKNYYFQPEAPTKNDKGRFDIKIISQETTFSDTNAFYVIECKRLNGETKLNSEYVLNGIARFTNEMKYPFYNNTAGMIGFVVSMIDIHKNVDFINQLLQNTFTQINTEKTLTKKQIKSNFEYSYCSCHKVGKNTKTIYHLMFDFSHNVTVRQV